MRQGELFTKTRREAPKDEVSKNAILLTRAGYINKEMAGVYDYLPLGLRVLKKIENIIREEMNALGAQELHLTALQDKNVWEKTNRWDDANLDVWFKTTLANDKEVGLATTHEEPLTNLLTNYISSYRDLPLFVYQFQTKFRNELRAKSGILRGREFLMKDLYSFSRDEKEHQEFYEKVKESYKKIFTRVGIGEKTYLTLASGGSFSPTSHEFQAITDAGEDLIYITDEEKKEAFNKEMGVKEGKEVKAIEVGNIFPLGTRFSEAMGLEFKDEGGNSAMPVMGSYGIGVGRLMGTVVEVLSDDKGLVWPKEISPFDAHLLVLGGEDAMKRADEVYKELTNSGVEVLYDDRDVRAGEKFADADLIGISTRIVVSDKSLENGKLEVKDRATGEEEFCTLEEIIKKLK